MLSALEPVGSVPDLTRLPRGGSAPRFTTSSVRLSSILSFSFFITKQMKTDLHAGQVSGTLPILYVFLARSGKTIRDVSPVALDDKGAAYFANEDAGTNATRGVRIHVRRQRWRWKGRCIISRPISPIAASGSAAF